MLMTDSSKQTKSRIIWYVIGTLLILFWLVPRMIYRSTPAFEAQIVDDTTGKPLKGVNAVYFFSVKEGTLTGHGGRRRFMVMRETVSDKDGWIKFSSAWVQSHPYGWDTVFMSGPTLMLIKFGYRPKISYSHISNGAFNSSLNGKMLRLKSGDIRQHSYFEEISSFNDKLYSRFHGMGCAWRYLPRTSVALHNASKYYEAHKNQLTNAEPNFSDANLLATQLTSQDHSRVCGTLKARKIFYNSTPELREISKGVFQ
jgi:hypothetical protein